MEDLNNKTKAELVKLCKERNIKGYSSRKKEDIIGMLEENTNNIKDKGQYFTKSEKLQEFIFDKAAHKGECLLEPSFGAGHLLQKFKNYDDNYPIVCYELDENIKPIIQFNDYQTAIYGDFLNLKIAKKFKTIIGNPPFVKQKSGNLYIKFVKKCYELLTDDGEILFIVPSDFIKLTSSTLIIEEMSKNGSFTDFFFPNDENLFEGANIDVVVFRYEKGCKTNKTFVNGKELYCNINNGIITFSETKASGYSIKDKFNVFVGMVSGRDNIYRNSLGNIDILIDKDKLVKYIFTDTFPTEDANINNYLLKYKTELINRRIKKFTEDNWFEWGAPRNMSNIKSYWGKLCIYVKNMTRNKIIAFKGKVQYFNGSLLCIVPINDIKEDEIEKIIDYMNSEPFQNNYIYSGRFKIGHKQLSSSIIPL